MSKNLIRKGLAIGASASLVVTALVGFAAPAQAAGELKLEPNTGTVYAVPATNQFALKTSYTGAAGETSKIKYSITSAGSASRLDAKASSTLATAQTTPGSAIAIGDTSDILTPADAATAPNYLVLELDGASSTTVTQSVGVQAFIDSNSNDVLDTGEWTSNSVTVTFLKLSEISWVVDIKDLTRTDTTATAYVTAANINLAQLTTGGTTSQVAAVFYDGATLLFTNVATAGYDVADDDYAANAMSYNATDNRLEATSAATTALAAGDSIKADIYFETTAAAETASALDIAVGGVDGLATGTANDTVVKTKTETVPAEIVTANTQVKSDASSNNTAVATNAAKVRTGATSLVTYSEVTYATGVTSAVVTFTVSEASANSIKSGATISGGGKTLSNTNAGLTQDFSVDVTANADGEAILTLTLSGLEAGNTFTVDSTVQGYSDTAVTYTVEDSAANGLKNLNAVGTNGSAAELLFATGAGVELRYAALDQYGNLLNVAGHTVSVSDGTGTWSGAVSSGYATVSIPAYSTATTKTMTPALLKNGVDVSITEPTAEVTIGTATAPAKVTGTSATGTAENSREALNLNAYKAADTRIGQTAPTVTAGSNAVISGTVTDSNLDTTISSVTVSSASLMFEEDGVWTTGSITVQTTSAGAYSVDAYSNKAGKHVVTITAGSATVTEEIWFDAAADDTATVLTLSAPTSVKGGRTLLVSGTLTDKFGNPVTADGTDEDFNLTYDGPGFVTAAMPTAVSATGTFSFRVLLSQGDAGVGTVSAAYDLDEDGDYTDTGDLTASAAVWVGPIANAKAGAKEGRVIVEAYRAKGKTVSVFVGATRVATFTANKANFSAVVKGIKSGTRNVSVRLSGPGEDFTGAITVK